MAHHGRSGDCTADAKSSEVTTSQNRERKLRMPLENVLSLGKDSEFFKCIKQVTRSATCHNCGLTGSRRCSRCHQTYYCSVECQKQDWKAHFVICRPSAPKEPNGINPRSGADEMNGGYTKNKVSQISDPKNMEVNGRKIMLCDIREEVMSEGTEFEGYAVDFSSPSNFFVKAFDAKSVDNLIKLTSSLQKLYSDPSNLVKGYTADLGEVCVAKYHQDQQWYRALVYNVEKTMRTAQVLYLDYGNTETVSLDSVQPMHKDVELLPPGALHCSLAHVSAPPFGWSPECLIEVKSLLVGRKLWIRILDVVHGEIPRYTVDVSLPDSGEHVHKIIIEKGYSSPALNKDHGKVKDPETVPMLMKQAEIPELLPGEVCKDNAAPKPEFLSSSLHVGDHFKMLITDVDNPEMFFCQHAQNAKQLKEIMIRMQERYSASPASPGYIPAPGDICAAQFTEDNNWYRASVARHVSGESVLVGYLDFGNTETLPISRVRRIDPNLLSIPFQAAQCCLAGVKPPSGRWTSEATEAFKVLVMNKILTACIVADCDGVLTLELMDESVTPKISISHRLIESGLAVPNTADCESPEEDASPPEDYAVQLRWTELPLGEETEVLVCMLQNPGEFFCHFNNQTDLQLLNKLNISLGQYCMQHKSEGYYPAREEICGAYYAGDGNWYRAQVKDLLPANVAKIQFLDYGNIEDASVDKLCKIPSTFLELPFQAINCSLSGVKPAGENWSEDSTKTFQKSVVGVKLRAKAVSRTKNKHGVELVAIESGAIIANVLIAAKCAVQEEKSVKESDANNNKALRPPRDPLLSRKVPPDCNSDTGALVHTEPSLTDRSTFRQLRPLQSIPLFPGDGLPVIPKTSKELPSPNAVPRDSSADLPGSKKPLSTNSVSVALHDLPPPKSIPSATLNPAPSAHRPPHSNNSSTSRPKESHSRISTSPYNKESHSRMSTSPYQKESHSPISTSPYQKESHSPISTSPYQKESHSPISTSPYNKGAQSRNSYSAAPRGSLRKFSSSNAPAPVNKERPPRTLSPSCQKEMSQAKPVPSTSRESHFSKSTSLTPSESYVSKSATPRESTSCVPPSPVLHPLLQAASPGDPCQPNSNNSREFQFSNSYPTAVTRSSSSGVNPDHSSLSGEPLCAEIQNLNDKSANELSAAGRSTSGVSIAQTWISVDLPLNEAIPACVLKVISPNLFYVFPKENRVDVKKLHQVMMEISEYCNKETEQHNYIPSEGDACCTMFPEDGLWYRAVVLELQGSSAKIAYADYGNVEVLPLSCLLPMKESFLKLPVQLTKCSLADVLPVTEPWPPAATRALSSVLLGAEVLITARSLDAGVYGVSVDKQQQDGILHVAETLVMDGLATSVIARDTSVIPVTKGCSEGSGCCCRDLLKRVEKLEEMFLHLLHTEKLK